MIAFRHLKIATRLAENHRVVFAHTRRSCNQRVPLAASLARLGQRCGRGGRVASPVFQIDSDRVDTDDLGHAAGHLVGGAHHKPASISASGKAGSLSSRAREAEPSAAAAAVLFANPVGGGAGVVGGGGARAQRATGPTSTTPDRTRMAMAKEEKSRGLYRGGSAQCAAPALPGQS